MRKSLYDEAQTQLPSDCHEAVRWNELSQEFGVPRGLSLPQAMAILAVISAEQNEEIAELNAEGKAIVIPVDANARVDN